MRNKARSRHKINMETASLSEVLNLVADIYKAYANVDVLLTAPSELKYLNRWLSELKNLEQKVAPIFSWLKKDTVTLKEKPVLNYAKTLMADVSKIQTLIYKNQSLINARINSTQTNLKRLKSYPEVIESFSKASARHKTADAVLSEFLFKLSERLGGPTAVFQFFGRFQKLTPREFQRTHTVDTIRKRIERHKKSLSP